MKYLKPYFSAFQIVTVIDWLFFMISDLIHDNLIETIKASQNLTNAQVGGFLIVEFVTVICLGRLLIKFKNHGSIIPYLTR